MKSWIALVIAGITSVGALACSGGDEESPASESADIKGATCVDETKTPKPCAVAAFDRAEVQLTKHWILVRSRVNEGDNNPMFTSPPPAPTGLALITESLPVWREVRDEDCRAFTGFEREGDPNEIAYLACRTAATTQRVEDIKSYSFRLGERRFLAPEADGTMDSFMSRITTCAGFDEEDAMPLDRSEDCAIATNQVVEALRATNFPAVRDRLTPASRQHLEKSEIAFEKLRNLECDALAREAWGPHYQGYRTQCRSLMSLDRMSDLNELAKLVKR